LRSKTLVSFEFVAQNHFCLKRETDAKVVYILFRLISWSW